MLDNRKRTYALQSRTVKEKAKSWFIRFTDRDESWRGTYKLQERPLGNLSNSIMRKLERLNLERQIL
jgi:hypothetical protein